MKILSNLNFARFNNIINKLDFAQFQPKLELSKEAACKET
jgi:hypothetical protein